MNKAIDAIVSRYQSSLKVVSVISCDAETVLKYQATINHLARKGIKLASRIPYEHEKIAERLKKILREKMNTKLSELPYTLPKVLYDRLASSIINNPKPNYHDPTGHLSAPTYSDSAVGDNPVSSHTTHSASDKFTPGRNIPIHGEQQ